MIAPDTSVVIAALAPWHSAHARSREALRGEQLGLVAHVAFETTSALSRMPHGQRIAAPIVLEALERAFPTRWLALDGGDLQDALTRAVRAGIRGGALYDALVGATASAHDALLLSADRRAVPAYEAADAHFTMLG